MQINKNGISIGFANRYNYRKIINRNAPKNKAPKSDNFQKHYLRKQSQEAKESQLLSQAMEKMMRIFGY